VVFVTGKIAVGSFVRGGESARGPEGGEEGGRAGGREGVNKRILWTRHVHHARGIGVSNR